MKGEITLDYRQCCCLYVT